jgi:hypothetical protein
MEPTMAEIFRAVGRESEAHPAFGIGSAFLPNYSPSDSI